MEYENDNLDVENTVSEELEVSIKTGDNALFGIKTKDIDTFISEWNVHKQKLTSKFDDAESLARRMDDTVWNCPAKDDIANSLIKFANACQDYSIKLKSVVEFMDATVLQYARMERKTEDKILDKPHAVFDNNSAYAVSQTETKVVLNNNTSNEEYVIPKYDEIVLEDPIEIISSNGDIPTDM